MGPIIVVAPVASRLVGKFRTMASFSLKLPAQAAVMAASSLTLTGCMSLGGNSSAHAPAPAASNPCGATTCSAPEPPPKKGFLGLCSHDKNRDSLLARLTGQHKEQPHPSNSPVPLAPGEFIVSYNQGPPAMPNYVAPAFAAPAYGAPAYAPPACSTPVGACMTESFSPASTLMPSVSSIMPAPTMPCSPPATSSVIPSGVLPPAPVTSPPPLAPNTVAPPAGTPQAQPTPAPGSTTSKTFIR